MKKSIILCVAIIAGIFTSCSLFGGGEEEEKVVKITSMFSTKVQQYNYLSSFSEGYAAVSREINDSMGNHKIVYTFIDIEGNEMPQCQYEYAKDFSEGLAAVMKDSKYGFINTKGEVVIPFNYGEADCFGDSLAAVCKDGKWGYINREGVEVISIPRNEDEYLEPTLSQFSEGVAFVINPHDWASFKYYAIDKTGKKLFEGTIGGWCSEEGGRFQSEYLPKFSNGEVYIPSEDYDTYDVYNKQGQMLRTEKGKPNNNYEVITRIDTVGGSFITRYGLKEIRTDSTDKTPLGNIPVRYDKIHELKNGVALVCLYEYDKEALIYGEGEGGYIADIHYGYVDLYGNDTFSQEIKNLCEQSLDNATKKVKEYEERRNKLNGTWRTGSGNDCVYRIFNLSNNKCLTYYSYNNDTYEMYFSINENGELNIAWNGDGGPEIELDYDRQVMIIDGIEWTKYSNSTTIDTSLQGASSSSSSSYNSDNSSNQTPSYYGTLIARKCYAEPKNLVLFKPAYCYFDIYYDGVMCAAKRVDEDGNEIEDEGLLPVYMNPEYDKNAPYNSRIKDYTYSRYMVIYKGLNYYLNIPGAQRYER